MNCLKRIAGSLLVLLLVVTGCRTAGETVEEEELPRPREVNWADYEDFEVAAYREEPPAADVELVHDVPENLMSGRSGAGEFVQTQGFRIQVFSSLEREEAEEQRERVSTWWRENVGEMSSEASPVVVRFRQPYYRVRVGNFTSRAEAEQLLGRLNDAFDTAFVVPDEVTVRR